MKVCIPTATGGHLTQVLNLLEAFGECDISFITLDSPRTRELPYKTYLFEPIGASAWQMLKSVPRILSILWRERPDVVFSAGAEIAVPVFYIARLLGAKTIFVETVNRVDKPTWTGRLVYPITDLFLVQHPQMLSRYGRKARYEGSVI